MRRWVERVYARSPIFLQHAMISAYGWKLARLRYGGAYTRYLEELLASQYFSESELAELQNEKVRLLVSHCYENVPYYAQMLRQLKLTPSDFRGVEDLAKLPLLDKETVHRMPESFHAQNYCNAPLEVVSTSGTTGTTLRIKVDVEGRRKNYAFFSRLKAWAGVKPSARSATFAGRTIVPAAAQRPPFWRYSLLTNTLLFSSYHLSEKHIPAYVEKLREWDPELIDSYPSSIHALARYASDHNVPGPRPQAVITSSETLMQEPRELISRVFKTKVFDQYGSAEQACFISDCEHGNYHVHSEFGVAEFLPLGSPGGASRLVATGFTNWAMPLLRYDTGDLVIPSARVCICGRKFKVVDQIIGRMDDLVITPDGRRVGRLDPVFKGLETIRRAQIIQETLERIRVRIVPGKGFLPAHQDSVREELKKRLGDNLVYVFEIAEDIPVGAGGKFRAVISKVAESGITRNKSEEN
jgi:phenylacetate-coenzyme A ligase PaaK-like adenylate-forming protein